MPHLKHLSLTVFLLFSLAIQAQWVSIPDTNFGTWLNSNGYTNCLQGNNTVGWQMDTTCPAVINAVSIDCSAQGLSSIEGVQYFDSLDTLYCYNNQLRNLPSLPALLTQLGCSYNQIDSLPSLPIFLNFLGCGANGISNLPKLPITLSYLDCGGNQLSNLPELPNSVTYLSCFNNTIISLPDLPDSLTSFICSDNLNLICLPPLKKVVDFTFYNTGITCLPNYPQSNTYSNPALNTVPLCDFFNTNECGIYQNISGRVYYDIIQNCLHENGEARLGNVKINLYESNLLVEQTISDYYGLYSLPSSTSTYQYTVDTINLPFTIACPDSGYYTSVITAQDSFDTDMNFGLRCKPGFDLEARGIATPTAFRPANFSTINISAGDASNFYGANCAAGVSGAVTTTFNGPVQFISAAPGALVPSVNSNTLTYTIADFGAVNFFDDFNIVLQTDTSAQIGQQVCFTVSVTPIAGDNNPANNTLTHCFPIVNSYDPNDKTAYPAGNTDTAQKELTYTIRFQNTGNAEAQHIYITDTLSQYIDESSFQLLAYSHQPMVQLKEKAIRFNFPNINLPDSFSNEPASHGYVQYKVRLKENLPIGTEIENTAFIYFDFNAPVITNTTVNTISVVSSVEASLMADIGFGIYPNPTTGIFIVDVPKELVGETITITDITGRIVHQSEIRSPKSEINIATAGVYFVRIGSSVKRVVVR